MKKKKKEARNTIKISKFVVVFALFLFVIMALRLSQLALFDKIDDVNLATLASKRTTKTEIIPAKRGTIYDCNGEVLAQNVSSYTIIAYLDPKRTENPDRPMHVVEKEKTAELLAPILNISYDQIITYLSKEDVYQTEFGSNGKGLTELVKDKILDLNLPGIDFIETQKRYYPKGDFLSYILGYAKTDENGVMKGELGLEAYYDDILSGTDGFITYQKDLRGYKIANTKEMTQPAIDGKDIYLTIDSNIQFFLEQALKNSAANYHFEWLTMVVADAKTGAILGSSTTPSFDPNLRNLTNYLDINVSVPYEPGSTMKIFTYMAAMENGVYHGEDTFKSGTFTTSDGTEIGDWNRNGWGYITYDQGFKYSSNVGVVNLLNNGLTSSMLWKYFKKLGFGAKTGITLPKEATGKINFKYETEIYNAGFGQGITTTPMQNIQALTTLTNDGMLLKPYLVKKIIDKKTNKVVEEGKRKEIAQVASTDTVNKILELMDATVNERGYTGSGYRMDGFDLIGKTGTAQIASENGGGYLWGANQIISSFAGIYPGKNPEIIIYTSLKRPDEGSAKPITTAVKDVVQNVSKYLGTDLETVDHEVKVEKLSKYINLDVEQVKNEIVSLNLTPIIIGNGNKVIRQYPMEGTSISSGSEVYLVTNGSEVVMPNMMHWSLKKVATYFNLVKVPYQANGSGYVVSQSIMEGTPITNTMEIVLELSPMKQQNEEG